MTLRCPSSPDGVCEPVNCMMGEAVGCRVIAEGRLADEKEAPSTTTVEIPSGPHGDAPRLFTPGNLRYAALAKELKLVFLEDIADMPAILEYGSGEERTLTVYEAEKVTPDVL